MKTNPLTLLQHMNIRQLWLFSVSLSVLLTEIVVSGMGLLLKGEIPPDYLLTGLAASVFVASLVVAMLSYFLGKLKESHSQLQATLDALSWDITERKQAEQQLRTLSVAIEQSPASVLIADLNAKLLYVNPQFTNVTGYTKEEAIGKNPRFLHSGLTTEKTYQQMWDSLTQGEAWHGELINKRKNGEVYWEEAHLAPVKNTAGEITCYVGVKIDITERKQIAKTLEKEREFLKTVLNNIQSSVVACDENGLLNYFNQATLKLHGLEQIKIPPEQWAEHYSLYDADGYTLLKPQQIPLAQAFNGETVSNKEMVIKPHNQQPHIVLCAGQAFFDKNGTKLGAVVSMEDITKRKHIENQLRNSEAFTNSVLNAIPSYIAVIDSEGIVPAIPAK